MEKQVNIVDDSIIEIGTTYDSHIWLSLERVRGKSRSARLTTDPIVHLNAKQIRKLRKALKWALLEIEARAL